MQSNVTEITQKLLGALDSNYNVTNMAAIVEVITLLERVTITKEMLETTRLGKHINELRKHLASDALAKRAKLLVKKWRNIVLVANQPPAAAVVVAASAAAPETIHTRSPALVLPARSPALVLPARSPALTNGQARPPSSLLPGQQDDGGGVGVGRKRPPSRLDAPHVTHAKKHRANGGAPQPPFDYDFSDNSNSSFKDAGGGHHGGGGGAGATKVVVVNSDSNSSTSAQEAHVRESSHYDDQQQPKKRGRKKGSKNHKNLIEEAESSFSNKMAVSRGNAKVKTTQELIESLQNRALPPTAASAAPPPAATPVSPARSVDDWRERAAKLTERVSLIDQKLNSGGNRLKKHHHQQQQQHNQQPPQRGSNNSVHTPPLLRGTYSSRPVTPADDDDDEEDEEIIVVDDVPPSSKQRLLLQQQQRLKSPSRIKAEPLAEEAAAHLVEGGVGVVGPASLSEEEALRRLPPLDASAYHLDDDDRDGGVCWCVLEEAPVDGAVVEEAAPPQGDVACVPPPPPPALVFREHADCPARARLEEKYRLKDVRDERVALLHASHVDGMNGNYGVNDTSATDTIATATPTSLTYANHYHHHQQQQQSNQTQHSQQQSTPSSAAAAPDDINIVPNFYQLPAKGEACSETFKKYSISEAGDGGGGGDGHGDADAKSRVFREFHECLDRSSYDGNTLRILPYVIID